MLAVVINAIAAHASKQFLLFTSNKKLLLIRSINRVQFTANVLLFSLLFLFKHANETLTISRKCFVASC